MQKIKNGFVNNGFIGKFKNLTLNFNFVIIYIIHKMLVLLKNHLNYLKDIISECFFKKYNRLFYLTYVYNILLWKV